MSVRPDEGRPPTLTDHDALPTRIGSGHADGRHGDDRGDLRVVFDGPIDLTPEAAKVLLRMVRKHAARQDADDGEQRPVSPSTDRPAAPSGAAPVCGDGDGRVGPQGLGTATLAHPTPPGEANTVPE